MSAYSKTLPRLYDTIIGDSSDITEFIKKLVMRYKPKMQSLLELACGTGNVLKEFALKGDIYGLDLSKEMLAIAKKKVPHAHFIHADMSKFSIAKKFDVILCVYDSLNHLDTFPQWQKTFQNVNSHLAADGIFIFDMNTQMRLATLPKLPAYIERLNENELICIKVLKSGTDKCGIRYQFFKGLASKSTVVMQEEYVSESTFSLEQVEKELAKNFVILKMADLFRKKVTKKSGRIFFICKQKT